MERIIIDVREPKEFNEGHIENSVNIPLSSIKIEQFEPYLHYNILLVCQTGNRAMKVQEFLKENNVENVNIYESQISNIPNLIVNQSSGWSIDRQFRMTLGLLLAIFLIGYYAGFQNFIIIPIILCCGLIFTSIIDQCYMRMGIAMLPWNRDKKN